MAADYPNYEKLSNQDWPSLIPKLTVYATLMVRFNIWNSPGNNLPKGYEPKDFVFEAIQKTFEDVRKWNSDEIEILPYIKGVIKSLVSHAVNCADNVQRDGRGDELLDRIHNPPNENQEIIYLIQDIAKDDPITQMVLWFLYAGLDRQEIAKKLGLSTRTLDRVIRKIKDQILSY